MLFKEIFYYLSISFFPSDMKGLSKSLGTGLYLWSQTDYPAIFQFYLTKDYYLPTIESKIHPTKLWI
jgi:hypothetical protein